MPKLRVLSPRISSGGILVYDVDVKEFQTDEEMHTFVAILNTKAQFDESFKDIWEIL